MPIAVDRADDPRVAEFVDLRAHGRERHDWFVVEGVVSISRLVTSPYPVRKILVTPARWDQLTEVLAGAEALVYVAPAELLREIAGFDAHRGALATADRVPGPALADVLATARRLVVLEGSNDHENLGAIARSARALGADALLLDPTCADPLYRRSVRVSMGEVLHLPIVRCTSWPGALAQMSGAGFETWALTPADDAAALFSLPPPDRLALVAGAEAPGLTAPAMVACTRRVRIPLRANVDSLNLGHALAIAMAVTGARSGR